MKMEEVHYRITPFNLCQEAISGRAVSSFAPPQRLASLWGILGTQARGAGGPPEARRLGTHLRCPANTQREPALGGGACAQGDRATPRGRKAARRPLGCWLETALLPSTASLT